MSSRKSASVERNVALCYVRLSNTRPVNNGNNPPGRRRRLGISADRTKDKQAPIVNNLDSPERQRANIQAVCKEHGLTIEWYEDVDGHRSGTSEKNRPGWLALKKRLGDPDVAALVANDLSRLHRKSWRVGDLLDFIQEHDTALMLAAPGRQIDTSTPMGQMFILLASIFDEYYAKDIGVRAKDSIAHRKNQGKVINLLFGTQRSKDGYLEPSEEGAWLMADGHHEPGYVDDTPPEDGALWRGYFDCAKQILEAYAENKYGTARLAYQLNLDSWAYRDRGGMPRPILKDDIRGVVRNWPEYGGVVLGARARSRPMLEVDIHTIQLVAERSLFPVELLSKVACVVQERTHDPRNHGIKRNTRTYALNRMLYCAHCEKRSHEQNEPTLRSKLWGKTGNDSRYVHRDEIQNCGCAKRSITCASVENDVGRLLSLICVREDVILEMMEQANQTSLSPKQAERIDLQKKDTLARCERRVQAAKRLFRDGDMEEAEYDAIKREYEEEIQAWDRITSEREQLRYELKMCVETLTNLSALWDAGDNEQRQSLVRSLFTYIIYDLDARCIVSFKLKPWAERFIEIRMQLENPESNGSSVRGYQPAADLQESAYSTRHKPFFISRTAV